MTTGSVLRSFPVLFFFTLVSQTAWAAHVLTRFETTPLPQVTTGRTFTASNADEFTQALALAAAANPDQNHQIILQAGASFDAASTPDGEFRIPSHSERTGTRSGWIIVRSSAVNLLPEGTRVSPADAVNMPRLQRPGASDQDLSVIRVMPGARRWRFVGLRVTVSDATPQYTLINVGDGQEPTSSQLATDIVFDRMYLHSFSTQLAAALKHGINMNGIRVAVIDSYLDDFKAPPGAIPGDDGESKALQAWNSPGPFKIVNNFIRAAGINVLFGGADPNCPTYPDCPVGSSPHSSDLQPANLEFRRNHLTKDRRWQTDASFEPIVVKNNFELKNMRTALIEGNVFEYSWMQDQAGWLVVLNVRNQNGTNGWATIADVDFRLNKVLSGAGGIQFLVRDDTYSNPVDGSPCYSRAMSSVYVYDNLFDDINSAWINLNRYPTGGSNARIWQFGSYCQNAPPPNAATDMKLSHNTAFIIDRRTLTPPTAEGSPIDAVDSTHQVLYDMCPLCNDEIDDNLMDGGNRGIYSDAFGEGALTIGNRFNSLRFNRNALIGRDGTPETPEDPTPSPYDSQFRTNNFFPPDRAWVQFVDFAGGDYRLLSSSPLKGQGTTGTDVGANIELLNATTQGVRSP